MSQDDINRVCSAFFGLIELAEWELNCPACPDPPAGFHHKLREDVQITRQFLSEIRPDPGRYFTSPSQLKRGRKAQY